MSLTSRLAPAPSTLAELLVDRWHDLPAQRIPDAIYERTALCFLDTIGVALAAVACNIGVAGLEIARDSPRGPATVWGTDFGASAGEAAFANGMLAHAMEYDDLHPAAIMHSSAVVVPAAVAMAERVAASGRDMLAAAIVGYEMAAALGRLAPGAFQQHGFQSTAVLGTFAAAAIAARLLKLSKRQAVHALGIAGSMASGLMEYLSDGSDVKQMHPGWAAQSGIRAAELALRGFTGPSSIFEGRFGIYHAFARTRVGADDAREHSAGWEVEEMAPKPYPACLCVHPQVQAVLELRSRGVVTADAAVRIADIRCDIPSFYVGLVYEPAARKTVVSAPYEARFSAPYCIARALLDGRLDLDSFRPDKLRDPRALTVARKVTYRAEALPEFPTSFPARVTVTMADGVQHESYVGHNLGSAQNPMTPSQLEAKFEACAVRTLGSAGAQVLAAAIRKLPAANSEVVFRSALCRARTVR